MEDIEKFWQIFKLINDNLKKDEQIVNSQLSCLLSLVSKIVKEVDKHLIFVFLTENFDYPKNRQTRLQGNQAEEITGIAERWCKLYFSPSPHF